MILDILAMFSLSDWLNDAVAEFVHYFNHMNSKQWGIVSAASVAFGFLCMKGHSIRG